MLRRFLKAVIDYAVCLYLILLLAAMPFYNREGYSHIGTDKSYFFNQVTVLVGVVLVPVTLLYLAVMLARHRKELWEKLKSGWSVTDCFAAGYLLALGLSYACSRYRENALWGAAGWYMGLWPQTFFVLAYFFASKLWKPRRWVLYLGLAASGGVFALGYLNRFGLDPLGMTTDNASFLSTVGNINWYCGYLAATFFAGAALFWLEDGPAEKGYSVSRTAGKTGVLRIALLAVYTAVGFGTLVTQGSDSGVVALAVMAFVLFWQSAPQSERMRRFWQEVLLLGSACALTWLLCRLAPGAITLEGEWYGEKLYQGWAPFFIILVSVLALLFLKKCRREGRYPDKAFGLLARGAVYGACAAVLAALVLAGLNTA